MLILILLTVSRLPVSQNSRKKPKTTQNSKILTIPTIRPATVDQPPQSRAQARQWRPELPQSSSSHSMVIGTLTRMAAIAAGRVMMTDIHDGAFWWSADFQTDSSQPNVSTTIAFFNMGLLSSRLSDPLAFGRTDLIISSLEFLFFSFFFFFFAIFLANSFSRMGFCMGRLVEKAGLRNRLDYDREQSRCIYSFCAFLHRWTRRILRLLLKTGGWEDLFCRISLR